MNTNTASKAKASPVVLETLANQANCLPGFFYPLPIDRYDEITTALSQAHAVCEALRTSRDTSNSQSNALWLVADLLERASEALRAAAKAAMKGGAA